MQLAIDTTPMQIKQEVPAWESQKITLDAEQAKKLHLKDGQIINGVVKESSIGAVLSWNEQQIKLPQVWAILIGRRFDLLVTLMGNEYFLKPININNNKRNDVSLINYKKMATAESEAIISKSDVSIKNEASIGEAFAALLNTTDSIYLNKYIDQNSTQSAIFKANWINLFQNIISIYEKIINNNKDYDKLNEINPEFIKKAIKNSGLTFEKKLRNKTGDLEKDIKYLLLKALQTKDDVKDEDRIKLNQCLNEIEYMQLDNIQSLIQGYINIQFLLPINNGDIWAIHIHNQSFIKPNESKWFSIDIHSKNSHTGSIWLRAIFITDNDINMKVWIDNNSIARLIEEHKKQLIEELEKNHIYLKSLVIHDGVDPYKTNFKMNQESQDEP